MEHAFIVTIPDLDLVKNERYHLVLPHLYGDTRYVDFYKLKHKEGSFIIQDNSTFELKDNADWELLLQGVRENFISEIVVPERLRNADESIVLKHQFLDKYYKEIKLKGIRVGAVLQGRMAGELRNHLADLLYDDRVDTILMPFNFEFDDHDAVVCDKKKGGSTAEYENGFNRLKLLASMFKHFSLMGKPPKMKPIHLLGLHNPIELTLYQDIAALEKDKLLAFHKYWTGAMGYTGNAGYSSSSCTCTDFIIKNIYENDYVLDCFKTCIRGNDSSSAYWHAMYGVQFSRDYGFMFEKIKRHVDFNASFKYNKQREIFEKNKQVIKEFIK